MIFKKKETKAYSQGDSCNNFKRNKSLLSSKSIKPKTHTQEKSRNSYHKDSDIFKIFACYDTYQQKKTEHKDLPPHSHLS